MTSLTEPLDILLGRAHANVATLMIAARKDEAAKSVQKAVAAHKTVWDARTADDREQLRQKASVWATRQHGHRVTCPSCGSDSMLTGAPIAPALRSLDGDTIVETQQYLPSKFECIACNLKISGLAQLAATGLNVNFKVTYTYDAAQYYAPNDDLGDYEPDNNEP